MTQPRLDSRFALPVFLALAALLAGAPACLSTASTGTTATTATTSTSAEAASTGFASGLASGSVSGGSGTASGSATGGSAGPATSASATGGSTSGPDTTGTSSGAPPVFTLAGGNSNSSCYDAGFDAVIDIRLGADGYLYVLGGQVYRVDLAGNIGVAVPAPVLPTMDMIALGPDGGFYLSASDLSSADYVDQIFAVQGGVATLLAGNGGDACGVSGSDGGVGFSTLGGMVMDSTGNLIVTDISENPPSLQSCTNLLRVAPDGTTTNLAGNGVVGCGSGGAALAELGTPGRVVVDHQGNIFVADIGCGTIREITPDGGLSTLAGSSGRYGFNDGAGAAAEFSGPVGLAIDDSGNLYVADTGNHCIRKVTPQGVVTTVAGNGTIGAVNGSLGRGGTTEFISPEGVAVSPDGSRIYVADQGECAIRVIEVGPQ